MDNLHFISSSLIPNPGEQCDEYENRYGDLKITVCEHKQRHYNEQDSREQKGTSSACLKGWQL